MKKNVGTLDAHIRLFTGFSMLGMGILRSSKTLVAFSAMNIATGISRFCPIMHMLKLSTIEEEEHLGKFMQKIPEYVDKVAEELRLE